MVDSDWTRSLRVSVSLLVLCSKDLRRATIQPKAKAVRTYVLLGVGWKRLVLFEA